MVAALDGVASFPQCFVLLDGDRAVGTACLVRHDLAERPALSPWLSGVVVDPESRGQGHAGRLVRTVEDAGRAEGIGTMWLYTNTAEAIYERLGWVTTEIVQRIDKLAVSVMRRQL